MKARWKAGLLTAALVGVGWTEAAVPPGADVLAGTETNASFTTAAKYGDVQVHVEWREPKFGERAPGGWPRGMAHLFFGDFCRLNFHDSYQPREAASVPAAPDRLAGAVTDEHAPLVNASRPVETWQSFDAVFRRPRWEGTNLVFRGELTVFQNGVLVQDRWAPQGCCGGRFRGMLAKPRSPKMKLIFANSTPGLRVRNFWVKEL